MCCIADGNFEAGLFGMNMVDNQLLFIERKGFWPVLTFEEAWIRLCDEGMAAYVAFQLTQ